VNSSPATRESETKRNKKEGEGGGRGVFSRGYEAYERTRHREAYRRGEGGGNEGERVSSFAFSCIPLCHGGRTAQTLFVRPRCVHMQQHTGGTAPGRAGPGLVALAERGEKERPRKTERNDAPLMCTRCLSIRGHESPKNTELCDRLRNAPHCSGFLRAFVTDGRQRSDIGKHRAATFPLGVIH